jgi:SpoVK/Ycf46/Vps4 family AAA+-type ATPase
MASGKVLRQLIKAGVERDTDAFRLASEAVISEEREKQHHLLANDLERVLYGRTSLPPNPAVRKLSDSIPVDKERGFPLVQVRESVRSMQDIVLTNESRKVIDEIILERNRADTLRSYGLSPIDRILFYGPPGCGKTLAAEVIAHEVSLPFAVVRVDSVMSSYLGETAASLRRVFDFISANPVVALFDEFDALAKERTDTADHGELRRVVNAVLQMIDEYRGESIIVAATNHESILDTAVWRRFDEALYFDLPNASQIQSLLLMRLRGVRRGFDVEESRIADKFKGMTFSDIERVLRRAIKEMVLQHKEFLEVQHLHDALKREKKRGARRTDR